MIHLRGMRIGRFLASFIAVLFLALPAAAADILSDKAAAEAQFKFDILKNFVRSTENQVLSLAASDFTRRYADGYREADRDHVSTLFHAVAAANTDYMQVRFLDMNGRERVRVDRVKDLPSPRVIPEGELQDKGGKSYFQGPKSLLEGEVWHSNFNLNMERGKIEMPIRPTFRVSTPVHVNGNFRGIVVINLAMDRILKLAGHSADFEVFMIDRDGEFILHPDPEKAWSRYLPDRTGYQAPPDGTGKHYSHSLEDLFRNGEDIRLLLLPTEAARSSGAAPVQEVVLTEEEKNWIDQNRVMVGIEEWPPVTFIANDGTAGGIAGSYLHLLSQRTGLQFDIVGGEWGILLKGLREKTIDLLPATYFTEERSTYGLYSEPYFLTKEFIYVLADNQKIHSINDLARGKIAIVKDYGTIPRLKKLMPEVTIVETKNILASINAVLNGEVDALMDVQATTQLALQANSIGGLRGISQDAFSASPLHLFSRIDKPLLHSILQKGLDTIIEEERRNIKKKWLNLDSAEDSKHISMSLHEEQWLSKHPTIRVGDDFSLPPYSFRDGEGNFSGIAASYLDAISKRLDVNIKPVWGLSWEQVLDKVKSGDVDILPAVVRTAEREAFLNFTKPIVNFPVVIATHRNGPFVGNFFDLKGWKTGVVGGYAIEQRLAKVHPYLTVLPFKNVKEGLIALQNEKIDAFIDNLGSITYLIDKNNLTDIKIAAPTDYKYEISIGVRKDWPELAALLDRAIDSIDDKERTAIQNSWLAVKVEFGLDIKTILIWAVPIGGGAVLIIAVIVLWNRRMAREINERIRAEKKLAEAEERSRLLLESVGEGVFGVDNDGKITFANPMATSLLGFTLDEMLGANSHELIHHHHQDGSVHPASQCSMNKSLEDGKAYRIDDEVFWRKDGTSFEVEYHSTPVRKNGEVIGAVLAFSDISLRKEAERRLAESEESTRRLLASIGEGVFGVDTSGVITFVNPQCINQLGYTEGELLGSRAHPLFHHHRADGSDYPVQECWMYKSFTEGDSYRIDDEVLWRKDGTPMEVEYNSTPIVKDDEIVGAVISFIDISLRKKAERELNDAFDVIGDSINYATHIQHSILPHHKSFEDVTSDHFIIWEPRDKVGGDLYWCNPWGLGKLVALGDCTGHGVPGAFMTMIANGAMEMATLETMPGDVGALLQRVHQLVQETLGQHLSDGDSDDGLDLGVCYLSPEKKTFKFAGARFSLFRVDDNEVIEIKGDKSGTGYRGIPFNVSFTSHEVEAAEHTSFYMTSDGLVDQVGGPKGRGFGKRRFKNLLAQLGSLPMNEHIEAIRRALQDYQGEEKRRDDVSVMGFRL